MTLVLAGPAQAGFDWQTEEGLPDADHNGLPDRAQTPAQAAAQQVRLRLVVTADTCRRGGPFKWKLDGRPLEVTAGSACSFVTGAVAEGSHELALAAGDGATPTVRNIDVVERLIVSIGDSVASGEGNPDAPADVHRARWLERRCHRSLRSGPALAARAIEASETDSTVTFVPLACSGATVPMGLTGTYPGIEPDAEQTREPAQTEVVDNLRLRRRIDAVLVSVGANDVYFSKIVQFCARFSDCPAQRFDVRHPRRLGTSKDPTLDEAVTRALGRLTGEYDKLDTELTSDIPRSRIIIVEYFDPTIGVADPPTYCSMDLLLGTIEPDESRWAHERVLQRLNDVVASTAKDHHWTLVSGVAEAFAGHGYCARPRAAVWVRTPVESFFRQDARFAFASIAGTLHPNAAGHRAISRRIVPQLAAVLGTPVSEQSDKAGKDDDNRWLGVDTVILLTLGAVVLGTAVAFVTVRHFRRQTT